MKTSMKEQEKICIHRNKLNDGHVCCCLCHSCRFLNRGVYYKKVDPCPRPSVELLALESEVLK
jgi:hypothetical protein